MVKRHRVHSGAVSDSKRDGCVFDILQSTQTGYFQYISLIYFVYVKKLHCLITNIVYFNLIYTLVFSISSALFRHHT